MLLLDLLISQNKLTQKEGREIEDKLKTDQEAVVDTLLSEKNISKEDIMQIRSVLYGLPIFRDNFRRDEKLARFIATPQAKKMFAIPIEQKDGVLHVGIVDPEKGNVIDGLQFLLGGDHIPYKIFLISYEAFDNYFGPGTESLVDQVEEEDLKYNTSDTSGDLDRNKKKKEGEEDILDLTDIDAILDEKLTKLSVPEILSVILRYAINIEASDIHIEHTGTNVRVRVRLDGILNVATTLPLPLHEMVIARVKILCTMKLDEKRKPQDGRFSTKMKDRYVDYRVSTFPGYFGEKVVIRILDSYRGVRELSTMGFSERQLKEVRNAITRPYGIILISGPTGSGKTTTLYAMLSELDREHKNVVSLEDPIEYNVPSMNQSQIFPEIGYTFASGLRSILRQDPDVIMVGEIRDAETAQLAIQAALTGHLVFSTIHTNTSVGVITRLIDMGIEPYLIAPTLNIALGQRLVRKIADGCAKEIEMTPGMRALIDGEFQDLPDEYKKLLNLNVPLHEPNGTKENPSGLKGRVPVFEVLEIDSDMEAAIVKKETDQNLWKMARLKGVISMKEDAILKSMAGLVPFSEINEM